MSLSQRAHRAAKREARRQKRSISSFLELWLEGTFGNGEVRVVPVIPGVEVKP